MPHYKPLNERGTTLLQVLLLIILIFLALLLYMFFAERLGHPPAEETAQNIRFQITNALVGNANVVNDENKIVKGSVMVDEVTGGTVTLKINATSSAAQVVQMQVWTNKDDARRWQRYSKEAKMPKHDYYYVQFKDERGNTSLVYAASANPNKVPPNNYNRYQ